MVNQMKKTVVLGASDNPTRYSNLAVNRLIDHHHPVVAIGKKTGFIGDVQITNTRGAFNDIDTITLYLNKQHQKDYYDYIFSLNPKRIIFNPGTENEELAALAEARGIDAIEACTLVMLATGQY